MGRLPSSRTGRSAAPALALLAAAVWASGCALLIPSGWRGRAPIPIAGPIPAAEATAPAEGEPGTLSDEQLRLSIETDERRLVEIASAPGGPLADPATEAELRAIAHRLPRSLEELQRRGGGPEGRIHHPVVR